MKPLYELLSSAEFVNIICNVISTIFGGAVISVFGYIFSKKKKSIKVDINATVVKKSVNLDKFFVFTSKVFTASSLAIAFFFFISIVGNVITTYIVRKEDSVTFYKGYFLISLLISIMFQYGLSKKTKTVFKDIKLSMINNKLFGTIILILPSTIYLIFLCGAFFAEISTGTYTLIFGVLFFSCVILGMIYFGKYKKFPKYEKVEVLFKNALHLRAYDINNYFEENDYICIKEYDGDNLIKVIKFNKGDIFKIDFLCRNIETEYKIYLETRGFKS